MSDMVDVPWMKDVKVGSIVRLTADGERKEFVVRRKVGMVSFSHWGMFEFDTPHLEPGEVFFMPFYVDFMWDRS